MVAAVATATTFSEILHASAADLRELLGKRKPFIPATQKTRQRRRAPRPHQGTARLRARL